MFEQTFVAEEKTKRDRTVAFALVLQTLGITGLALLPLLNTQPIETGRRFLLLPPAHARPEPPPVQHTAAPRSSTTSLRVLQIDSLRSRFVAPTHVSPLQAEEAPALGMAVASTSAGLPSGLLTAISSDGSVLPPLPARVPPPTPRAPLRVSSGVIQSRLLSGPKPSYPRLALTARITGTVRLQATISREGGIENLHVLSGHPLLNDAAMDAVRNWRYRPVFLNGDPVEVITEIDVNFTLQ